MCIIDRRSSSSIPGQYESFRKRNRDDSVSRRGSFERGRTGYERRGGSPDDYGSSLDNFRPVTLTVSSFFKQVSCCYLWQKNINEMKMHFISLVLIKCTGH